MDWKKNLREKPVLGESVYISPTACLIGKISIGDHSSVWPNVSARGDVNFIEIGRRTNVQDNTVLHVDANPLIMGDDITVGHGCILHGCTIRERCLIGMGSIVLDGAVIGPDALVGAGSLVKQGEVVPPGTLYLGIPARRIRDLTDEEIKSIRASAEHYSEYALEYLKQSL
ncbi:MAG: gamma carbonic anhydrase family protein [bacterium]|jgi:carbonic anhydrase/acetyltransferase-like protein (isoleucine patch superfamily)